MSKVLLIYTGGTIGMKTDPETGALAPFDFRSIYDEFPQLHHLETRIDICPFEPIDSSNVTPELWTRLAEIVRDRYDDYDGFVVLHGTDTMSFSASALSYALENLRKPVVFTGSQIPIGVMRTDGRENLITAIELAAARDADGRAAVPEVGLYFQNKLFRGNRTSKFSAEEFGAFRSENYPALADVGVSVHFNAPYIAPAGTGPLRVRTEFGTGVLIIKIFPGLTEGAFRAMLGAEGVRAVVLETYGSGNAPTARWFTDALREAIGRGIVVLNVTQCPSGSVAMELYETGRGLEEAGVVSGRDITTEAAVTKLMYLLGMGLGAEDVKELLKRSLRGEITQ
jgi:L-asparaginase